MFLTPSISHLAFIEKTGLDEEIIIIKTIKKIRLYHIDVLIGACHVSTYLSQPYHIPPLKLQSIETRYPDMDEKEKQKYEATAQELRVELKRFEGDWAKQNGGSKPSRGDIKNNPEIGMRTTRPDTSPNTTSTADAHA